jgi:hypothetical protein
VSTTRPELIRRLRWLLGLGLATTLALFVAYRGVHDDTVPLSSASAPGILAVDTARSAMSQAHEVVEDSGRTGDMSGEFHTRISVAHQSLALAASENVTGLAGRHDLQTVTGLIAVYSGWVERWGQEPDGSPLRAAYLHYAEQVLGQGSAPGTDGDIMSRLDALRAEQLDEAQRQADFTWQQWLWWSVVAVLYVALVLGLLEAQRFLRRRFRTPAQPLLLAATALAGLGVPLLAWITRTAQGAMEDSVGRLRVPRGDPDDIPSVAVQVEDALANAGWWASLSDGVLLAGALLLALTAAGLWPRIDEYRFQERR